MLALAHPGEFVRSSVSTAHIHPESPGFCPGKGLGIDRLKAVKDADLQAVST
jgi:hypothetical protein